VRRASRQSSKAPAGADGGSAAGLIVAAYGRRGELVGPDGRRRPCLAPSRGVRFVCGDRVRFTAGAGDEAHVTAVEPRRGLLERQPDRPGRPEPVAANLTHVLVLLAPRPSPDLEVADRYLAAALLIGAEAAIGWNKTDLAPPPPALAPYAAAGHPVFPLGIHAGTGLDAVRAWLAGGTVLVVGQSGVGKSSLLNRLVPAAGSTTGELSVGTGEGRHTTTATRMFPLGTGWLADTPGVRDFVPALPAPRDVARGFGELAALAAGCRFPDCVHVEEPNCAVKAALAAGRIDARRYASYRELLKAARLAADRRFGRPA
jgi:ribosome biogenesis GTPase